MIAKVPFAYIPRLERDVLVDSTVVPVPVAAVGLVLAGELEDVDMPEDAEDDVLEEDEPELCSTL